jgi:phosphoribosylformylglycinamidine (FGAM) synthase PurS component
MKAKVHVFLKPGVLDVEGKAIEGALHGLGWGDVANVRVGKTIGPRQAGSRSQGHGREALGQHRD